MKIKLDLEKIFKNNLKMKNSKDPKENIGNKIII